MRTRVLAQLVGVGVIVPTMLVALFYSVPGVMFALESLQAGEHMADAVQATHWPSTKSWSGSASAVAAWCRCC